MAAYQAEEGPYRLRTVSEVVWSAQPRRDSNWDRIGAGLAALGRLILPILLLLTTFAAMYLYQGEGVPELTPRLGAWLSISHLILPLAFFSLQLTNRRYGAGYAFAQLALATGIATVGVMLGQQTLAALVPADLVPTTRLAGSFGGAFFIAGFISILVFDGARGRRWWPAPLMSMWSAALVFPMMFFSAAYAGGDNLWISTMVLYAGVLAASGVVLLVPYWVLRGFVPPLSGYGGY